MKKLLSYFKKSNSRTIGLLLFTLVFTSFFTYLITPQNQGVQRISETAQSTLDTEEKNFLTTLNNHRKDLGLSELGVSGTLNEAAEWMAQDLKTSGNTSHTDSLGRDPQKRLQDFGYDHAGGENIALSGPGGVETFEAWFDSPGHKQNMENPLWKAVGIARVQGSSGWYWVSNYGAVLDTEEAEPEPTPSTEPTGNVERDGGGGEETNCSGLTNRADSCICQNDSECATGICTEWKSVSTGKYCGVDPDEEKNNCGPDNLTESGELDQQCYQQQKCYNDVQMGLWCKCYNDDNCASKNCKIPDGYDRTYCQEAENPSPTEEPVGGGNEPGKNQDLTLNISISLPGIGTNTSLGLNNNPKAQQRGFTVILLRNTSNGVTSLSDLKYFTYANGVYSGVYTANVPQGDYEIKLVTSNSLIKTVPGVVSVGQSPIEITLPLVNLITGNIIPEGHTLDIFDYNALLSCYEKACNNQTAADLNDDGKVDSLDLNILLRAFAIQRE